MPATLSPELLRAIAERSGRIALVVGAGCSVEAPTNLHLSTFYAQQVHHELVLDGLLTVGECTDPSDLSAVASALQTKHASQSGLVKRLPRNAFRMAQPNSGYLIAAALLREGVIHSILTLNFDLALSTALGILSAMEVNVVPGPQATDQLGTATVIYLHRNVDEADPERWILTAEALEHEWEGHWEEVVAHGVLSCPVVVFAGLGSPAAVLTKTVTRVRDAVDENQHHVFVVDPAATTDFEAALHLPDTAHVQSGWSKFMEEMAKRLLAELTTELEAAGRELCARHSWDGEADHLAALSDRLHNMGVIALGRVRAKWLLDTQQYAPDDSRRPLIADLLLGLGLIERAASVEAHFREDGLVELYSGGVICGRLLLASGSGTLRWSALEASVLEVLGRISTTVRPKHVLVSGVVGHRPPAPAPPENLVMGDVEDDIVLGSQRPRILAVDEIRSDPSIAEGLVA